MQSNAYAVHSRYFVAHLCIEGFFTLQLLVKQFTAIAAVSRSSHRFHQLMMRCIVVCAAVLSLSHSWLARHFASCSLHLSCVLPFVLQMAVVVLLMCCNMFAGQLLSTGAFEVFYNDQLVFSKIGSGEVPDINYLIHQLNSGEYIAQAGTDSLPSNAY